LLKEKVGNMKNILLKIGGFAGLVAIAGLIIAAMQLRQSVLDSKEQSQALGTMLASQELANATTVFILEQQLKVQSDIATLQAGNVNENPTVVAQQIQQLQGTAIALEATKKAAEATSTARALIQLPFGEATIFDGFNYFDTSGFKFSTNSIAGWGSKSSDILVAKADSSSPISFFMQYDAPPYQGAQDKNAQSGIIKVSQLNLSNVFECPETGYQYHWVQATVDGVYCVRTRDGSHYAVIQVTSTNKNSLTFTWIYQPDGSRRFQ
jgi:hypothetical protein